MGFTINGNDITLTRGDTFRAKIKIYTKNKLLYIPAPGDKIKFSMKESYKDTEVKLEKDIPYDTLELHIAPADTKTLPQPSSYIYEISITMADGTVDTFMAGKLNITQEVN